MKNKEKKKRKVITKELLKELLRKQLGNINRIPRRSPTAQSRTTA